MLPITHHRAFHVPHSLATLAAIVALVTALSWDADGDAANGVADAGNADATVQQPVVPSVAERQSAAEARTRGEQESGGAPLSGLLPLVLPSVTGR